MKRVETLRLLECLDEVYFEPGCNWPRYDRDVRRYSRWTVKELIDLIDNNPFTPCTELIAGFIDRMDEYYEVSKTKRAALIFEVARETAKDILDLF